MTPFTDDDMKKLKTMVLNCEAFYGITPPLSLSALIARLEAAETCLTECNEYYGLEDLASYITWRKSKGESEC